MPPFLSLTSRPSLWLEFVFILRSYLQHSPRFFIVYPDMSGTELLRYEDVESYLMAAKQDFNTAVLEEPVVEYPGRTIS